MSNAPPIRVARRHDLDALRAFAMILGIALHGALSFTGYPWAVQDTRTSGWFGGLFAVIHGFRMPLFIFLSGYFTMMLWRTRGMKALLKQRFQRVLLPCLLGLATIVPLTHYVSSWAVESASTRSAQASPGSKSELVEAIRKRDKAEVDRLLAAGADPNRPDPEFQLPPLNWAALVGDEPIAKALIERGADVNGSDQSGYRALHNAAFLGHPEVVDLLIRHQADPAARAKQGEKPRESTRADWGMTQLIARSLRLSPGTEDELIAGRAECRTRLARVDGGGEEPAPGSTSSRGGLAKVRSAYAELLSSDRFEVRWSAEKEPFHLVLTPLFDHLWFLWFLGWLAALFAVFATLAEKASAPRLPRWLILSPFRLAWLLPITMIPQLLMGVFYPSFGPDTSIGLLPQPHLLLYYGIFFGFGALYFDSDDVDGRLGRLWWLAIPFALLLALPLGLVTITDPVVSGVAQVLYAWMMTLGLVGLTRRLLSRESRTIRYLSDSAYWLYLAHLPLIILFQAWVRDWDSPASLKFFLICTLATGLLLISYQTMVRYTWLGRLLNGPRLRRGHEGVAPLVTVKVS